MPKISIIIPVYNTGRFLRRCLDSVCAQTVQHTEIICINDASEDNSQAILHEYATRDSRIFLIDFFCNKGVSAARNAGIAIAQGEYLGFVDSDDFIDKTFYEKLYAKACSTSACIVKGTRLRVSEGGIAHVEEMNEKVRKSKFNFFAHWTTAIYKTDFIRMHGINCPLGVTNSEDVAFLLKAVSLVPHIEIVDDAYYRYCRRFGSANPATLSLTRVRSALRAQDDIANFINTRNVNVQDYDVLFFKCLLMNCHLYTRTCQEERQKAATACATAMINLYAACKRPEALDVNVSIMHPDWLPLLQNCDAVRFAKYLLAKPATRMQKTAAALRAGLKL